MTFRVIPLASAAVVLIACAGFKDAMTAHVDVVAKAGSQELSVERLSSLLGQAKIPATPDMAKVVANLWVDYQLLGQAAAKNDSLGDTKLIDAALWPVISQERVGKWHDVIAKSFGVDTSNLEARYDRGDMLAAQHILFRLPTNASAAQKDSVRRHAEAIRRTLTSANFADVAQKNSQDPGSAAHGGNLGLFPKGVMVKPFEDAVLALQPGQISPIVETPFGYHIIRRATFAEVKDEFSKEVNATAMRQADSVYLDKLESSGDVHVSDRAVTILRDASKDLDSHAGDDAVLATSKAGTLTVGRLVRWVDAYPQKSSVEAGLKQAPDSQVVKFVRSIVRNELVLRQADSAKIELDSAEMADLHDKFRQAVVSLWDRLSVDPKTLADSAKTETDREHVASQHIESFIDKLMAQQASYVFVPEPIEEVLRDKYDWKVNGGALQNAVDKAVAARATADSARVKNRPPSIVPLGPAGKPDSGAHQP